MSAAPLLRELQAAGVTLSATGDRLHIEAPAGTVTPELRQRIADNKAGLLAELHPPTDDSLARLQSVLLALADSVGVERAMVERLTTDELAACKGLTVGTLRSYLLALADTATRQAGKVPAGDTAAIHCAHCGPVYAHPDIAAVLPVVNGWPRALGCPWCAIRKVGGYVPRPRVSCATCTHWQPDTVNPDGGMGSCASGHGMHYPMQRHGCGSHVPAPRTGDH